MKKILEKGSFKTSMYLFIGTGLFLIGLFSYQLYTDLYVHEFKKEFPGDWGKTIGIGIGIFLIIRSQKFRIRSRDLFIEITPQFIRYQISRTTKTEMIQQKDIEKIHIKKGKIKIKTKASNQEIILDLNTFRLRDNEKSMIIGSLDQFS